MQVQQALWSGRFSGGMDDSTLEFTSSLDVDSRLAFYDVMGSLAHVAMLKSCGIIPADDADAITAGLREILGEVRSDSFELDFSLEDIHTNVEFRLTERIGPAGGKLHTGRSRNDQVATDFRMYLRDEALSAAEAALSPDYEPYYLYRQKYIGGSFENIGWTRPGFSCAYNIAMMEEISPVLGFGAGAVTKLTHGAEVSRLANPKYAREYLETFDAKLAAKSAVDRYFETH